MRLEVELEALKARGERGGRRQGLQWLPSCCAHYVAVSVWCGIPGLEGLVGGDAFPLWLELEFDVKVTEYVNQVLASDDLLNVATVQ